MLDTGSTRKGSLTEQPAPNNRTKPSALVRNVQHNPPVMKDLDLSKTGIFKQACVANKRSAY
jgi:hypothetical protein